MLISRLRYIPIVLVKTLKFYQKNGLRLTLIVIVNRLRLMLQNRQLSFDSEMYRYQYLAETFPEVVVSSKDPTSDPRQWKTIVESLAHTGLRNLFSQLNINGDAEKALVLIKKNHGEDGYFSFLINICMLEQIRVRTTNRKVYDLVQTSNLPEISKSRARRHILFVTSQFPNPQNGGGNRVLNFIKILSEENDIYLAACFIPNEDEKAFETIAPYCRSILKIPLWKYGSNQAEIHSWLRGVPLDIIHYEWTQSLENYDPSFAKYQIFTYMEAASLRQLIDMESVQPLSDLWATKLLELVHILRLELVDTSPLSGRIAVTTKDADFFRSLFPYQEYAVLNHGITFDDFCLPDVEPEPHTLVFVGNYHHRPNVDAMVYFFQEIWERITREVPEACIYMIGPKPPPELTCYEDERHVIVTGGVADIRPYIQKASVCIAPLITGAGLRGKVIDYAALRRPFVATSIATEDLAFGDKVDCFIANTAQEFAQKVVTLLNDKVRARQMGLAAFETSRKYYDNRRLTDFLLRYYEHLEDSQNAFG